MTMNAEIKTQRYTRTSKEYCVPCVLASAAPFSARGDASSSSSETSALDCTSQWVGNTGEDGSIWRYSENHILGIPGLAHRFWIVAGIAITPIGPPVLLLAEPRLRILRFQSSAVRPLNDLFIEYCTYQAHVLAATLINFMHGATPTSRFKCDGPASCMHLSHVCLSLAYCYQTPQDAKL
ncbi:hypothetical protein IG631_08163 [Alternaria alternata]|nr:hypothetical protein IG631_08163 [Alternaria alternata]